MNKKYKIKIEIINTELESEVINLTSDCNYDELFDKVDDLVDTALQTIETTWNNG